MKHIFLILIVCITCVQTSIAQKETDRQNDGFVGAVKKVFEEWSPVSGINYPIGSRCRQMTNIYNESGRILQHSVYPGACGNEEFRETYTYAQDGSRTERSEEIKAKDSSPSISVTVPGLEGDTGQIRTIFKYNSIGRLIEEATVTSKDKILYKYTHMRISS